MEKNLYIDASHPDETRIVLKSKDQKNNITSMVAASIMFEIISLISVNLKR